MARLPPRLTPGLPRGFGWVPAVAAWILLGTLAAGVDTGDDTGDASESERKPVASIEDRLAIGLKAKRPEDVAYLKQVAGLVREGKLPAKVVDSTYLWALRRRQTFPFPSFRRALDLQAERLGVEIE